MIVARRSLYVPNKSLDYYLASDNLRWIRRLKICIGAARGLAYLHSPRKSIASGYQEF
ncbi:putative non-specific serine/threonine protein kinase [Helianthus annuus]|nr:putative non-specific serine/threonine protein kinase [Helianthus annuus]